MKRTIMATSTIRACVIGTGVLAIHHIAAASLETNNVSVEVNGLRKTVLYAEMYMAPPDVSYRADLSEADVMRVGCHYKAVSQEDINSLIDVVATAMVSQVPSARDGYDARVVVRFFQGKTRYVSLSMSPDYSNAPSNGMYFRSDIDGQQRVWVEAKNGVEKKFVSGPRSMSRSRQIPAVNNFVRSARCPL